MRTPGNDVPRWKLSADVEALTWHPHQPTCFLVSSEDGIVACFDARKGAGEGAYSGADRDAGAEVAGWISNLRGRGQGSWDSGGKVP